MSDNTKKRILTENTFITNKKRTLEYTYASIKPLVKQKLVTNPSLIPSAVSPNKSLKDIKQIIEMNKVGNVNLKRCDMDKKLTFAGAFVTESSTNGEGLPADSNGLTEDLTVSHISGGFTYPTSRLSNERSHTAPNSTSRLSHGATQVSTSASPTRDINHRANNLPNGLQNLAKAYLLSDASKSKLSKTNFSRGQLHNIPKPNLSRSSSNNASLRTETKFNRKTVTPPSIELINDLTQEYYNNSSTRQDLIRSYKKLMQKIEDANTKLKAQTWKFQSKQDTILNTVNEKEKFVNEEIEEFESQMRANYESMKSMLADELKHEKTIVYKVDEILELQQKTDELIQSSESQQAQFDEEFDQAKRELEISLEASLLPKIDEINSIESQLEKHKDETEYLTSKLGSLENRLVNRKTEKSNLQKLIIQLDFNYSNFEKAKFQVYSEINDVVKQIELLNKTKIKSDAAYNLELESFHSVQTNLKNYDLQRRITENSIMDLEKRVRVYVLGLNVNSCGFNKSFDSNEKISEEYCQFIKSSLKGSYISLLFYGIKPRVIESVISSCQALFDFVPADKHLELKLKGLNVLDSTIYDLFDNNNVIESSYQLQKICSQEMKVDKYALKEVTDILQNMEYEKGEMIIYILSVKVNNIKSSILFLDFCGKSMEGQIQILKKFQLLTTSRPPFDNCVDDILYFSYQKTRCLFLANIESHDPNLLSQLSNINKLKSV